MKIRFTETDEVVSLADFYARYPNTDFVQPLSDEVLTEAGIAAQTFYDEAEMAELRTIAADKINAWRLQAETCASLTFPSGSLTIACDDDSYRRLSLFAQQASYSPGAALVWRDADNKEFKIQPFEITNYLKLMISARATHYAKVHERQLAMKAQLPTMTAEELLAFQPGFE